MPPRRRALASNPIDVEVVRRKLAEGKIVRVGIAGSAQFPEGGTGRVRQVGDPEIDGEEFVQVEVTLNGTRDVLPFTPGDLTPATRGRPPGSGSSTALSAGLANKTRQTRQPRTAASRTAVPHADAARPAAFNGTPDSASAVTTRGAQQSANGRSPAGAQPASGSDSPRGGSAAALPDPGATPSKPASAPKPPSAQGLSGAGSSTNSVGAGPPDARTKVKSQRGARRPPAVAITVATTDADPIQWRIEARVGAKVTLRSGSVSPARVWELVRLLDNDTLTRAIGSILDEQRAATQARADALAAELEHVRAELADLPDGTP